MNARWKAGDVAMVAAYNRPEPYRAFFDGKTWREYDGAMSCVNVPTSLRPLVVLDQNIPPESLRSAAEILRRLYYDSTADLLREIAAQTYSPKPTEPTGYLAMVEDADGEVWVRDERDQGVVNPWRQLRISDRRTQLLVGYSRINAVRVLSEGVTS